MNKLSLLQITLVAFASCLPHVSAYAGNGMDRGGGDFKVNLASLMPLTIDLDYDINYRLTNHFGDPVPQVRKKSCPLIGSCYFRPDYARIRLRLELRENNGAHYEISGSSVDFYVGTARWDSAGSFRAALISSDAANPELIYSNGTSTWDLWYDLDGYGTAGKRQWHNINHALYVWVDGIAVSDGYHYFETFVERLRSARTTLFKQVNWSSAAEARKGFEDLNQVSQILRSIAIWRGFDRKFPIELLNGEYLFLEELSAQKEELLSQAKSAVRANGTCKTEAYEAFLNRLANWRTGSSSYFLEIEGEQAGLGVLADTQLTATGIRDQLHIALTHAVVPYCEKNKGPSKVDLYLDRE